MKGWKMLLAARMARDREGSIQYPIVSERNVDQRQGFARSVWDMTAECLRGLWLHFQPVCVESVRGTSYKIGTMQSRSANFSLRGKRTDNTLNNALRHLSVPQSAAHTKQSADSTVVYKTRVRFPAAEYFFDAWIFPLKFKSRSSRPGHVPQWRKYKLPASAFSPKHESVSKRLRRWMPQGFESPRCRCWFWAQKQKHMGVDGVAAIMPGPCKKLQQHQWSSGWIHLCHHCDPGSIAGWCKCTLSCTSVRTWWRPLALGPQVLWKMAMGAGMCKPCADCGRQEQAWQCVRVARGMDQKSIVLCLQGFESPRCRMLAATLHGVVSVLISVTTDMSPTGDLLVTTFFLRGGLPVWHWHCTRASCCPPIWVMFVRFRFVSGLQKLGLGFVRDSPTWWKCIA